MDYRRRQYRLPATLYWTDDEFEGSPISDSASASLPVDTNVLADPVLLEVVEGLSFNQRTALLMRADGISQRAIAAELGISVGALKAALDRAKNNVGDRLRARLEQGEAIDPSIVERLFEDAPEDDSPE
jgi:DNA-directed RNA polymerase specialized sigma24 family protein